MNNNEVTLIGNMARDPVVRATKTGRTYAFFSVATNKSWTDQNGESHEITYWPSVIAWGDLAEAVGNLCGKGTRVFVEGEITTRTYDTPEGQRKYVQECVAKRIWVPLQGTKQKASSGGGNFQQRFGDRQQTPPQTPPPPQDDAPFPAENQGSSEEEIPF